MHRDKNYKKVVVVMEGSGGVVGLLRQRQKLQKGCGCDGGIRWCTREWWGQGVVTER